MSYKIEFYDEALDELDEIYNFYFQKSPGTATKIYNTIIEEIEYLKDYPNIAAVEPLLQNKKLREKEGPFRSLIIKEGLFKVIYYLDADTIVISRIWCCRTNPQNINE
jgi:plasmid stabilization system protein ParE